MKFIDVSVSSSHVGSQGDEFLRGEGDAWFSRNHSREEISPTRRLVGDWCKPFKDNLEKILEIGAGSGLPLAYLCDVLNATGEGIEPSQKAVNNWSSLRANAVGGGSASLRVGVASELPYEDQTFDLVVFGFCLYLVDRSHLYRAVAEADRVLRDGGFLVINDFDSTSPYMNEYSHKEGIFSYKNDYSNIFTSSGHYHLVSKHSHSHSANHFDANFDERVSTSLLYKQENTVYTFGRPSFSSGS